MRPDAQAVVLFDQAFSHDMRSLQALRRNALWLMEVWRGGWVSLGGGGHPRGRAWPPGGGGPMEPV